MILLFLEEDNHDSGESERTAIAKARLLQCCKSTIGWFQKCISTRPEVSEADPKTSKKFRIILK